MTNILIISSFIKPVPDVNGGAVETLLTNLIKHNEVSNDFRFHIVSMNDTKAKKEATVFKNSSFSFLNETHKNTIGLFFFRLYLKIIFHINKTKMSNSIFNRQDCTYLGYKTFFICKRFKPKYLLFENYEHVHRFWHSIKIVGPDNCFFHIHSCIRFNPKEHCFFSNIISVSNFCLEYFNKNCNVDYTSYVLKNCANSDVFSARYSKCELLNKRYELGIKPDDFVIVYTGRIVSYKGVKELIESVEHLKCEKVVLLLLGEVIEEENTVEKNFRAYFDNSVRNNQNIKYAGFIPNKDLPIYLQLSDLQIMPSIIQEGAGLSAIEGLVSGLPLIVTNSGGLVEYVNSKCAIILEYGDDLVAQLTKTIKHLMDRRDLLANMSIESKKEGLNYTFSNYYTCFTNIFKK